MLSIHKALVPILLLGAGCSAHGRILEVSAAKPSSPAMAAATSALLQAESRWNTSPPKDYTFTVTYSAFIATAGCWSQTFRVRNGHSSTKSPPSCHAQPKKFGSVPALFRFSHSLIDRQPDEVVARYDPKYGYPLQFHSGSTVYEDSYFQFEVTAFRVDHAAGEP